MTVVTPRPRWPALDGLRAIAVLLVIGYHAIDIIPNGFIGVDIFFVLSGFLITSLLLREADETHGIRLLDFYRRRVQRLYPALLLVCIAIALLAVALQRHVSAVVSGAGASIFYFANIWEYSGHNTYLLQHTWTLALEEQFYLVWPLGLLLVLRNRRWLILLIAVWIGVELADGLAGNSVLHTYVRAAGLPLGCLLAWAARSERVRALARILCLPALAAIIVIACVPVNLNAWLDGWPVSASALLAMPVVLALTSPSIATTALSARWLQWIGKRSYGLYLWHFPVLSIAINNLPAKVPLPVALVGAVILTFVISALSYRFIEQPILRWRPRHQGPKISLPSAVGMEAAEESTSS
jgi:peptidoglycan/LPS O-acetylase OafA/YrhL